MKSYTAKQGLREYGDIPLYVAGVPLTTNTQDPISNSIGLSLLAAGLVVSTIDEILHAEKYSTREKSNNFFVDTYYTLVDATVPIMGRIARGSGLGAIVSLGFENPDPIIADNTYTYLLSTPASEIMRKIFRLSSTINYTVEK